MELHTGETGVLPIVSGDKSYRYPSKTNSNRLKRVPCNCFAIKNAVPDETSPDSSRTTAHHLSVIVGSETFAAVWFLFVENQDRAISMAARKRIDANTKLHQADCTIDPYVQSKHVATLARSDTVPFTSLQFYKRDEYSYRSNRVLRLHLATMKFGAARRGDTR